MGFFLSKIYNFFSKSKNKFKILILGLQNAGKTTILYRLSLGQNVNTQPTIGSNVEEICNKNLKFQTWDLGGQETMRSVWDAYYMNTDAIIYVIDSSDSDSYDESKKEFYKVLNHEELKDAIILVFANKQDLNNTKKVHEIIQIYGFDKIKDHIWHIEPCSAKTGEGLVKGLEWLSEQVLINKETRFPNNPYVNQSKIAIENYSHFEQDSNRTSGTIGLQKQTTNVLETDNKIMFN